VVPENFHPHIPFSEDLYAVAVADDVDDGGARGGAIHDEGRITGDDGRGAVSAREEVCDEDEGECRDGDGRPEGSFVASHARIVGEGYEEDHERCDRDADFDVMFMIESEDAVLVGGLVALEVGFPGDLL